MSPNGPHLRDGHEGRLLPAWLTAAKAVQEDANPVAVVGELLQSPRFGLGLRVKKSSAAALDAGSLFKLTYANNGLAGVLCRVQEKTVGAPEHPYATIRWKEDRGYLNATLADVAEDATQMEDSFEPAELNGVLAVEPPYGYTKSSDPTVALLPARGDALSNGWNGYWRSDESTYDQIGASSVFALLGTLQAAFPATVLCEDDFAEPDVLVAAPDPTPWNRDRA